MAGEFSCDRRFFTSGLFTESHTGFRACHSRYSADRFTIRIPPILKKSLKECSKGMNCMKSVSLAAAQSGQFQDSRPLITCMHKNREFGRIYFLIVEISIDSQR